MDGTGGFGLATPRIHQTERSSWMNEETWIKLGDQTAGNLRSSQITYMLAVAALTATIVFGADSDASFLLTVAAIGVGLFGLLTFENSQQGFMALMKGMPASMASTEMGAAFQRTPFMVFRLANAVLVALIAGAQIMQVN